MPRSVIAIVLLCIPVCLQAAILYVPADQPTIQSGIDSAAPGDTVLVAPGIYLESVDFGGKALLLASEYLLTQDTLAIAATVIQASGVGPVVRFSGAEDSSTCLIGFTLTGGTGLLHGDGNYYGGAIAILDTSTACPRISHNYIYDNACLTGLSGGAGAAIAALGPLTGPGGIRIENNRISRNRGAIFGAAVFVSGGSEVLMSGNLIVDNGDSLADSATACIVLMDSTTIHLWHNTIASNVGAAIRLSAAATAVIRDNIFSLNGNAFSGIGSISLADTSAPKPVVEFNCFDDLGSPLNFASPGLLDTVHVNSQGTPCDSFFNIYRDPLFCSDSTLGVIDSSACAFAASDSAAIGAMGIGCYAYHGPVWHVSPGGDDSLGDGSFGEPFATIQCAIDRAWNGDTVMLLAGAYSGPGNFEVDFGAKAIVLNSLFGPAATVLDCGGGLVRGLVIDGGQDSLCVVRGITISHADIGIFTGGSPSVCDVILADNDIGALVYGDGEPRLCSLTIRDCYKGLWCEHQDSLWLEHTTFYGNQYGVYLDGGAMSFRHCVIDSNTVGLQVEQGVVRCSFVSFSRQDLAINTLRYHANAFLDSCKFTANKTAVWGDCTADSCRFFDGGIALKRVFRNNNAIRNCRFEFIDTVFHDDGSLNKFADEGKQQSLLCDLSRTDISDCGQVAFLIGGTDGDYEGLSIDSCQIHDNSGGVWMDRGRLLMQDTEYRDNGGGIRIGVHGQTGEDVSLRRSTILRSGGDALHVTAWSACSL
jgi:hypothetical protein